MSRLCSVDVEANGNDCVEQGYFATNVSMIDKNACYYSNRRNGRRSPRPCTEHIFKVIVNFLKNCAKQLQKVFHDA